MSLVARYRSPTVFEFVEEQCFDLSEGGMFIKSKAPAPSGTLLKIECQVAEGPEQIIAVARVVWLRDADNDDGPKGMGVKFVKLENGSSDVINQVLARASKSLPPHASASTPPRASNSTPPSANTTSSANTSSTAPKPSGSTPAAATPTAVDATPPAADATPSPDRSAAAHASTLPSVPAVVASAEAAKPEAAKPAKGKSAKGKSAKGKSAKAKPEKAKPEKASATTSQPAEAKPASKPATASAPASQPSPASRDEGGTPAFVWAIGALLIAAIIFVATRNNDEPAATPQDEAPAAAIQAEPPVAEPQPPVVEAQPAVVEEQPAVAEPQAPVAEEQPAVAEPQAPVVEPQAPVVEPQAPVVEPQAPVVEPQAPVVEPQATVAEARPAAGLTYVVNVMTTPRGAVVSAAEQTCTAPCTLRFATLTAPIKVNASKARHHPTAATLDANAGFTERDGALHKTLYLKLHPEASAASGNDAPASEAATDDAPAP